MIRDKQLKVYDTVLFQKSYIRDIVITQLLYVRIECVLPGDHYFAPYIIHSIYEYNMTDLGPVAISTSTTTPRVYYLYNDTKFNLQFIR